MSLTVKPTHLSHFCNSKNKNRKVKLEVGEEVFVSQKFPLFFYKGALKPVARNVMKGGCTKKHVILQTRLTEPQGKLKI